MLRNALQSGERIAVPALVLYEWLRGPRHKEELTAQEALFPADLALAFRAEEASISATLYRRIHKPRGRELDIAIAAWTIFYGAALWTLNIADFVICRGWSYTGRQFRELRNQCSRRRAFRMELGSSWFQESRNDSPER